ncbi:MAG: copper resistance protein NlpE [Tannerella sp.]|jgi:hypothetical protein|nr:copper resistance protein NlpE [Tannerella sp.]
MDRFKWIAIAVILFFITVNTSYFWSKEVGIWLIPLSLLLVIIYLCFFILFFIQIFKAANEKFSNNKRLYTIILLVIVLFLTAILPKNPNKWEGENLLVAAHKGAASCSTTLRLKPDGKFKYTSVCFGIEETRGTYKINGDTVFFEPTNDKEMYTFGIICSNDTTLRYPPYPDATGIVRLYRNRTDSITRELYILTNNLCGTVVKEVK